MFSNRKSECFLMLSAIVFFGYWNASLVIAQLPTVKVNEPSKVSGIMLLGFRKVCLYLRSMSGRFFRIIVWIVMVESLSKQILIFHLVNN